MDSSKSFPVTKYQLNHCSLVSVGSPVSGVLGNIGQFSMRENEDHGGARDTDPDTSHEAAHSVNPTPLQFTIAQILLRIGPATTHEIADACMIGYQTITPRMKAMREKKMVYDTGFRRSDRGGPNRKPTNRVSIVWDLYSRRPEEL
jgi:hypothetical protein